MVDYEWVLAKGIGVPADGKTVTDAVCTAASSVVTSATAAFVLADEGKLVTVYGGGAAGANLATTILSVDSATQVTLSAAPGTSQLGGTRIIWGSDCTAGLAQRILDARSDKRGLFLPAGLYLVSGQLVTDARDVWKGVPGRSAIVCAAPIAGAMVIDNDAILTDNCMSGLTLDANGLAEGCLNAAWGYGFGRHTDGPYRTIGGEIELCNFLGFTATGLALGSSAHVGEKLVLHDSRVQAFVTKGGSLAGHVGVDWWQSDSVCHDMYVNSTDQIGINDESGVTAWDRVHVDGCYGTGIRFGNAEHRMEHSIIDMSNDPAAPTKAMDFAGTGRYYVQHNWIRSGNYAGSSIFYFSDDLVGAGGTHYYVDIQENSCSAHSTGSVAYLVTGDAGIKIGYALIKDNYDVTAGGGAVTVFNQTERQGTLVITNPTTSQSVSVPVIGGGNYITLAQRGVNGTENLHHIWFLFTPGAAGAAGTLRVFCETTPATSATIAYWIRTCYGVAYAVA